MLLLYWQKEMRRRELEPGDDEWIELWELSEWMQGCRYKQTLVKVETYCPDVYDTTHTPSANRIHNVIAAFGGQKGTFLAFTRSKGE
jgi:hypothetical protein